MGEVEGTLREIRGVLHASVFTYSTEAQLQDALERALRASGMRVHREVWIGDRDRVDLLYRGGGIEVKIASSSPAVMRQITRYCASPQIKGLLLVTGRARHLKLPPTV